MHNPKRIEFFLKFHPEFELVDLPNQTIIGCASIDSNE
jgi:hypothetical protein